MRHLARISVGIAGVLLCVIANAEDYENSRGNLMVVLRETQGVNKLDETLKPAGPAKATIDGKVVEFSPAWFDYLGDMHVRFVFDAPSTMRNLSTKEFAAFHLTPEEGIKVAMANLERVYGPPVASVWTAPVMIVEGKSPDLNSSYLLDHDFWAGLLKQHPEGIVAAVPKRGGLLYVPASDTKGFEGLRRSIGMLFSTSENQRVSSALYLFKDGHWSVFQAPVGAK
jgi:hypothetical protein